MGNDKIKVLDLYCGLGGLSLGFEMTGAFVTVGGIDNFDWAVKTFYHNHPKIDLKLISKPQDISALGVDEVLNDLGFTPDVIVGGPPCQGFSHAGKRLKEIKGDVRNEQVFHFLRFVKEMRPKVFLMENVSGILGTGQKKKNELLDYLEREYREIGYNVNWNILDTSHYRVPQIRKRLIMVGFHENNKSFEFPIPPCAPKTNLFQNEEFYTVEDALSDMPSPSLSEPQPYESDSKTTLQKFLRKESIEIYNHLSTQHSASMIEKLQKQKVGSRLYPNWNHSWYRLDPSRPSPAVKENHRAPFVHFSENRATSPRECARLQTIPDRFILKGTKTAQLIMIGNAVPPIFAAHLASAIAKQYFKNYVPIEWSANQNPLVEDWIPQAETIAN